MDDHGRGTDEAPFQKLRETLTSGLLVISLRIKFTTVSDPGFFGLADFDFAIFSKEVELHPQFSREPEVIGV
jgi:hypothetical protein